MTDAKGEEMSDRWAEALVLAQWAREIWEETAGDSAAPDGA
jgi:hypothetical protein